jgi:predicted metal-dependent phosphoesterase TrpH
MGIAAMRIDLHSHSNASDGTEPPSTVVRRARAAGVEVLALTDHDTVAGLADAAEALPDGLTLVPGMELSCRHDGASIHMLAYLFDAEEPTLAAECERIRTARDLRARQVVDRLIELGVPLTWEQVAMLSEGGVVGRPHIARAMVAAGVITDPEQAFTPEWIDRARRPRPRVPVRPGPGQGHRPGTGLAPTGSSDDHGDLTGHRLGCETTQADTYQRLLTAAVGSTPITR